MHHWLNAKVIGALPMFIALNIATVAVWLFDISQQTMPLILGIIAGGLVDLDNRLTGRLKNIFYTLLAFSLSSVLTQLSIHNSLHFTLLITSMTFCVTMIGAIGERYRTIAFGTLVIAIYTALTYDPNAHIAWFVNPFLILLGTLLYSLMALLVHLLFPNRPVQESVANSFAALADYLDSKASFFDPDSIDEIEQKQIQIAMKNSALIEAFNLSRTALFYRIRGQHRHLRTTKMLHYYSVAQSIHDRVSGSHFDYHELAEKLKNTDLIFRLQRLLELQAAACRQVANSLQQNQPYRYDERLAKAMNGLLQSFELNQQKTFQNQGALSLQNFLESLQEINQQLKHLEQQGNSAEAQSVTQLYNSEQINGLGNIWFTIKSHCNFESQLFRHAVRLSIAAFFCCSIAAFGNLERAYWVLMTCIFVCQPNYSATKLRLKQRVIGTILGVIVGSLLPYIQPTLELQLALIVITSTLFFFFRTNNYSFSTFFITLQVLISFDVMGFDVQHMLVTRLVDTIIGTGIAWLAVSYLWPDWKYLQLDKISRRAIDSDAKYLLYVIARLQFGTRHKLKYQVARRYADEYAAALSTTVSNMNNEPKKYQAYLQTGFELLKLNYSLLSYISALGAYGAQMKNQQQNLQFLTEFYPVTKRMIKLLENLDNLSQEEFAKQQQNIDYSLKQAQSNLEESLQQNPELAKKLIQQQFNVPVQQLNMIAQVLPPLYQSLQKAL